MPDRLEDGLRDALNYHAAQLDRAAIDRLQAIDYRPRRRRVGPRSAVGTVGVAGAAGAVVAVVLGSSAAPAFAGWQAKPAAVRRPLASIQQLCGQGLGTPVLADSRGPYTAAIYSDSDRSAVCLSGNGVSMNSTPPAGSPSTVATGAIELAGGGLRDSDGNALTLVDGRVGTGVTGVTVQRSDGSTVQASVENGWYLAWWPGSATADTATVTTASGSSSQTFPAAPAGGPNCPSSSSSTTHCSSGYGFDNGGRGTSQSSSSNQGSGRVTLKLSTMN
jgi:hypothetical protein